MADLNIAPTCRFGVFEVDFRAGELHKHGIRIALQEKPFRVLETLLSDPGEVITRDELRARLWTDATFVDFDHSINIAISKLRQALGDSGNNPRFIETTSRHGYRFIAPVQTGSPASVAARKTMLAVLPFEDLSGDPGHNYFSDGLTEEMITQLAGLDPRRLGVIARTTSMYYKGTSLRADQIGRDLGVDYILEGSIRRSEDRVRITAQLIQVSDQTHLFAETYDRKLSDVLDIQHSVARRIARSLQVELLPERQAALSRNYTPSPAAHEAYLRGRWFWNRRTEEGFAKAIECFEQAIQEDAGYAVAYAGLADAYNTLGLYGGVPSDVARQRALETAARALEIDPTLAEAHTSLAYSNLLFEWDWQRSESEFKTAAELNPNCTRAHQWYGHLLAAMGRFDEALRRMDRALALDPLSLVANSHKGWILYFARCFEQAAAVLRTSVELDPNFALGRYFLGLTCLQMRKLDDAIAEFERAGQLSDSHPGTLSGLAQAYAWKQDPSGVRRCLDALDQLSARRHVSPYFYACVHASLGDADRAIRDLEGACCQHCPWMAYLNVDPAVDPLRRAPRFQELLERVGFR